MPLRAVLEGIFSSRIPLDERRRLGREVVFSEAANSSGNESERFHMPAPGHEPHVLLEKALNAVGPGSTINEATAVLKTQGFTTLANRLARLWRAVHHHPDVMLHLDITTLLKNAPAAATADVECFDPLGDAGEDEESPASSSENAAGGADAASYSPHDDAARYSPQLIIGHGLVCMIACFVFSVGEDFNWHGDIFLDVVGCQQLAGGDQKAMVRAGIAILDTFSVFVAEFKQEKIIGYAVWGLCRAQLEAFFDERARFTHAFLNGLAGVFNSQTKPTGNLDDLWQLLQTRLALLHRRGTDAGDSAGDSANSAAASGRKRPRDG